MGRADKASKERDGAMAAMRQMAGERDNAVETLRERDQWVDQLAAAVTEQRDHGLYIDRLGVDPARQGSGLGGWLLVKLEELARSRGFTGMSLETAEMMEHLVRLYRRHGFEIVGRGRRIARTTTCASTWPSG